MTKSEWRKKIKNELLSLEPRDRKVLSEKAAAQLFTTERWMNANIIGITVSRKFELDTTMIIKKAWDEGKTVCVPKCYSSNKQMEFRELNSFHELENVYMDLYEPIEEKTTVIEKENIDLLIVPGLIFDKKGYRIGYGGGYYDRYLQNYQGSTISICYSFQTAETLPFEEFDVPVDRIITEEGRYK
ncbi:5-formyltetrahydrofolate cyclo-ligase [Fictibacillus phosphorivorans]|uniref:5-formyltetrahydrofolate cyclo-ligase n=1 Tax=Fictibacillus phosphorivorans TaxID=1221500 RepID=UPI00203FC108|nr:5-formyltetrahydrofolate cyclo-ligase [Fictibacillus phosphorivorans]MCM3716813.1 5-formyltetrahydrofolate cyclo-ligase [Fictibacillus phosphorivorans]MCM3774638.1 5-formyltetrahydrofolate cyclo-ligase [Fictibacillus phosphorivorans]